MGLGMLLAHVTRGHDFAVWVSFLSLTIFHMFGECAITLFWNTYSTIIAMAYGCPTVPVTIMRSLASPIRHILVSLQTVLNFSVRKIC